MSSSSSWCRKIALTLVVLALPSSITFAELPQIEPIANPKEVHVKGIEPKPRDIEDAFNECLRQVDTEAREISNLKKQRLADMSDQMKICHKGRSACIATPRSPDCHAFVEDYAIETFSG